MNILEKDIDTSDWVSLNPMDKGFREPVGSGVYAIIEYFENGGRRLLYIGCSRNLHNRIRDHEIIRIASFFCWKLKVYFKECDSFIETESRLIARYLPPLNRKLNG